MTASPFAQTANPTTDDLEFTDPGTDFLEIRDLDGRLVCVYPKEIRREDSKTQAGKQYDKVIADVIVLDGPTTDKIEQVPMFVPDMHLSAGAVVGAVRGNVRTGKPVLGRIDSRPSRMNRDVKAYGLQAVDAATKAQAAPIVRSVLAAQDFAN
jgi:hypothetical protein